MPALSSSCSVGTSRQGILTPSTELAGGRALEVSDRVDNTLAVELEVGTPHHARSILTGTESARVPTAGSDDGISVALALLLGFSTGSRLGAVPASTEPTSEGARHGPEGGVGTEAQVGCQGTGNICICTDVSLGYCYQSVGYS